MIDEAEKAEERVRLSEKCLDELATIPKHDYQRGKQLLRGLHGDNGPDNYECRGCPDYYECSRGRAEQYEDN